MVLAPKPLLSGVVPLEAFLATLQKVWLCSLTPSTCSNSLISSRRALLRLFFFI